MAISGGSDESTWRYHEGVDTHSEGSMHPADGEQTESRDVTETCYKEDLPIDRGWAWFVLAGCFLNMLFFVGYTKSLSILFVKYLHLFEASATATSLIMGVIFGVFSVSALFTMHFVLERLEVRKTATLGATICSAAMATAVFAPNITFLICVHCVAIGIGYSMMFGPGMVIVGQYFKRRRALAMATVMSATSIASGIFPVLTRLALDEYGIRGTMLIFTGMTMNMFVGGSLFRPLTSFKKQLNQTMNAAKCADVQVSNHFTEEFVRTNDDRESVKENIYHSSNVFERHNMKSDRGIFLASHSH